MKKLIASWLRALAQRLDPAADVDRIDLGEGVVKHFPNGKSGWLVVGPDPVLAQRLQVDARAGTLKHIPTGYTLSIPSYVAVDGEVDMTAVWQQL